jgi:hypothetical protein
MIQNLILMLTKMKTTICQHLKWRKTNQKYKKNMNMSKKIKTIINSKESKTLLRNQANLKAKKDNNYQNNPKTNLI